MIVAQISTFQPTRPLRGATAKYPCSDYEEVNFNPRAPCGARHQYPDILIYLCDISTHAPLAGRDFHDSDYFVQHMIFQPTRPLRGATQSGYTFVDNRQIFQPTRPLRGATNLV